MHGKRRVVEKAPTAALSLVLTITQLLSPRLPHTHSQPPLSLSPPQTGKRKLCWCVLPEDLGHTMVRGVGGRARGWVVGRPGAGERKVLRRPKGGVVMHCRGVE